MSKEKIIKIMKAIFKKLKKIFKIIFIILIIIYVLILIFARQLETFVSFPWIVVNVQDIIWKVSEKPDFEDINITLKNGKKLNWLYIDNHKEKTIYYFHWNWGPLPYFYSEIKYMKDLGYNVMAYDYPWYGKSEGFPYYEDVISASEEFYDYMKKQKKFDDKKIIVWWYSIWTAVSVEFANNHKNIEKLVLLSALSSRYDMSRHFVWFALQKILFRKNSFVSEELVKNFNFPVLMIHWNADFIVPFWEWKKVFKNYAWEKNFIEIEEIWHNFIIDIYGKALRNTFTKFLNWKKIDFKNNYFILWFKEKRDLERLEDIREIERRKNQFLKNLDLKTDSSLQKFVSAKVSFNDKSYVPADLEKISSDYVFDAKWWQKMRKKANEALQKMAKAFFEKFSKKIVNVSAYRSYLTQKSIKDRGCPDKFCAKAGFSEHQSGLAIDFFEASTEKQFLSNLNYKKYFDWMKENAHKFGFHNSYQKWIEIDSYVVEPWHWRYLWVELATYLKEKNITIAEYYNSIFDN